MSNLKDEVPQDPQAIPCKGGQQKAAREARADRVAAALRANLLKRKQQARARAPDDEVP